MRKLFLYYISFGVFILAINSCLSPGYEYRTILDFPEKHAIIKVIDIICIQPFLSIEDNRFLSCVNFSGIKDSMTILKMDISISSIEHPDQDIKFTHVLAYEYPTIPERLDYVSARTFDLLPGFYKNISLKRAPWNTLIYYFETTDVDSSDHYRLDLNGLVLINGQNFLIKKSVVAKRRKAYLPIRMMP